MKTPVERLARIELIVSALVAVLSLELLALHETRRELEKAAPPPAEPTMAVVSS